MRPHRRPSLDGDDFDLRSMAEKEADRRDTGGLCLACRAGSHKNCRSKTCGCPSSVHEDES